MELTKEFNDQTCVVTITGRLDTTTAPSFEAFIREIFPENKNLIFNLKDLEYISSAGLRTLLIAQKEVTKNDKTLTLVNVNDVTYEILEMTGFSDMMTIEQI